MLKTILLATAVTFAAPAIAQTTPTSPSAPQQTVPTTPAAPAQADPMQAQPATPATPATSATPADPAVAAAAATAGQPAATGDQVAQVVTTEFPTYDKNSDGNLSKAEFASWMTALKAADPGAKKDAAANKKWNEAAFAQADTDKSKSVSKDELTGFLSQASKAS